MNGQVNIIHHAGLISANLDAMVARYERLGFMFTPLSRAKIALTPGTEPQELGAGNRCAIFESNYLELLGVIDREKWSSMSKEQRGPFDLDTPLSRYEGLHVMHFGTDDIEATRELLIKLGTACSEVAHFQRNVDTPQGEMTMYAKCLHFPAQSNPEGLIQIAQHLTPKLVLQPRYIQHRNGARALTECIVCTTDPASYITKYERYTGHRGEQRDGFFVLELDYSRVVVTTPEHLDELLPGCVPPALPCLVGFTVATVNLDMVRSILNEHQVPFQEYRGRVMVRPEEAYGSAVLFENIGTPRL
ncbi:VOC family protein [Ktedonosporobacter rubrisoli]|uniref:VOC family protein n=1 Tax=Ktedonosporobacter rubrisoli TaxID=2509675 RepID=A0A4P6JXZ9_KTERU|nr:VOC family protein [Ktedonosporobacter rubrisoli]QBD80332.1 VOC family protein [Ktedonosporobacter rubrisoli]